jgi:serine protease Do
MKNIIAHRWREGVLAGVLVIAGTALAVNSQTDNKPDNNKPADKPSLQLQIDEAPLPRSPSLQNSYAPIVQKVAPSVVKISVTSSNPEERLSGPDMDFFRRFFGNRGGFGGGNEGSGPMESPLQHALGSGVIVSPNGYILTNNHVVNNAKEIEVGLNDGRNFTGTVVGSDPQTDIALIRIKADNLPAETLADSDKVEIGDVVLAVGNPFGIGQTVTSGIVSAKNRATSGDMDQDFIQTDAAINPGNSGGALVDSEGRLVGINTAILSRSGGNQGIGFAVPSNLCRWVMDSLVRNGKVSRGFLGVQIQSLTPNLAQAFKIDRANGALVADVTAGSPAEAAGLKSGDVITKFNNQPVQDAGQLKLRVAETPPGTSVPIQVNRNGETKDLSVTVKELNKTDVASSGSNAPGNSPSGDALHGVAVGDLDRQTRAELKVPQNIKGAVVTEVEPGTPAAEAGLEAGDVILEINHRAVNSAQDAVDATSKPTGSESLVKVWSHGGTRYLTVEESH